MSIAGAALSSSGTNSGSPSILSNSQGGLILQSREPCPDFLTKLKKFLSSRTPTDRLSSLANHTVFPGFYAVTALKNLRPLLLPQVVTIDDNGTDKTYLLGSVKNSANDLKVEYLSALCTHNVIVAVEKKACHSWFTSGNQFDNTHAILGTFCPKNDGTKFVLASVPCVFPIPYGANLITGAPDDNHYAALDAIDTAGGKWLEAMLAYNKAAHEAVIANKDVLGNFVPKLKKSQQFTDDCLFVFSAVDESTEAQFENQIQVLGSWINTIRLDNIAKIQGGQPADRPADVVVVQSAPADDNKSVLTTDSKGLTAAGAGITELDKLKSKFCYFLGRLDNSNPAAPNLFVPATLSQGLLDILAESKKTDRIAALSELLLSTQEILRSEDSPLSIMANLPGLDLLSLAYLASCELHTSAMDSLEEGAEKKGFNAAMVIPKPLKDEDDADERERQAEELLGETNENKAKLSTTITVSPFIHDIWALLSTCANVCIICRALATWDLHQPDHAPALYQEAYGFFKSLRSDDVAKWWNKSGPQNKHVLYWGFGVLQNAFNLYAKGTKDSQLLRCVSNGLYRSVSPTYFVGAHTIVEEAKTKLVLAAGSGEPIPEVTLWKNSVVKQRRDEAAQRETAKRMQQLISSATTSAAGGGGGGGHPGKDPKRQKVAKDVTGDLIFSSDGRMPMPTYPAGMKGDCPAFLRQQRFCKMGPERCNWNHEAVNDMSQQRRDLWVAHVKATPNLIFNNKSVKPEVIKMAIGKTPAAAPAPAPAAGDGDADAAEPNP